MDILKSIKLSVFFIFVLISACSSSEGTSEKAPIGGDPVTGMLHALGVATIKTPLKDDDGNPLPNSFSPLGASPKLNKLSEMFIFGANLAQNASTAPTFVASLSPSKVDDVNSIILRSELKAWPNPTPYSDTPWADVDYLRASTGEDIDGDGLDDMIVVYYQKSARMGVPIPTDNPVQLKVYFNRSDFNSTPPNYEFEASPPISIDFDPSSQVNFLDITGGDFDGDGKPEVAVVVMENDKIEVKFLKNVDNMLIVTNENKISLPARDQSTKELQGIVRSANLDLDSAMELAVVINEYQPSGLTENNSSHIYLFDDANTNFKPIPLPNNKDGMLYSDFNGSSKIVATGNVALGDVDGDGIDEIILGGTEQNGGHIKNATDIKYVITVLDDISHGLVELGHIEQSHTTLSQNYKVTTNWMRYVHINAVDIDGNGTKEIQANEFIFDNVKNVNSTTGVPILNRLFTMPSNLFMFAPNTPGVHKFTWRTSNMVAANVLHLSDGREQIIMHSESLNAQRVRIFGLKNTTYASGWGPLYEFAVASITGGSNSSGNSQYTFEQRSLNIVPINVNNDSLVMQYVANSHEFVYSEPVVIAALAAAPCYANIGQDLGNCSTAYGIGNSSGQGIENTLSVSVGYTWGAAILGGIFGKAEATGTFKSTAKWTHTRSVDLETHITYTNSNLKDAVIFTSIPLDLYRYRIIRYPRFPNLEGQELVLRSPRKPVVQFVSREYYNSHVLPESVKIDDAVFAHQPGNPHSYPTEEQKNALESSPNVVPNPFGYFSEITRNTNVLESDYQSVPQGVNNSVSVGLDLSKQVINSAGIGFDFTLDLKTETQGVVVGWEVGVGDEVAMSWSHGTTMSYSGTVPGLPEVYYSDPRFRYSYGLFTYVYQDENTPAQYEVVNYWVGP